ncbi:TLDc domain-containing protein [Trichostrongylus colubriformis]|uniref:TLDc domain-containing protein n=1 Tax=Trichostrongylus colubriformis TaxID=6319 RepID=A0AAN8FP42_TRICO
MGNTEGKAKTAASSSSSERSVDKRVEQAFVKLTGDTSNCLTIENLKEVFSEGLAVSLWKYLSDSKPYDGKLTLEEFARYAPSLWGTSTDVYVKVCQPVLALIKQCSDAAGAGAVAGDEQFIGNLARSSIADVISWKHDLCPQFCHALRDLVLHVLLDYTIENVEYCSEILTAMQMWYVQASLPQLYFPKKIPQDSPESNVNNSWTPLYSSAVHGISVNRYENNVFDYKGPTVSIFHLTDQSIFVLATEDTWRHSASRFGGSATELFQISPHLKRFRPSSSPIYCNFKIRSAAFGLSFLDHMKIDKEMSNVTGIEVPLPGNWDDNPDKTILEMAGVQFSNERKLMEMEARSRQN